MLQLIECHGPAKCFKNRIQYPLTGDFNFHLSNIQDKDAKLFSETLCTYGLTQHIKSPTHTKQEILDLVITRSEDAIISSTSVASDFTMSDHFVVRCDLCVSKPPFPQK